MQLPEFLVDHPDGEIRLKGHRIGLFDLVFHSERGESAAALHERFPSLPRPLIEDVLAFYDASKPEVDAYIADQEAQRARLRESIPPGPTRAELRRRLEAQDPAQRR